jgi:catechol 2,3-dioxygenase-like lactoylglutathione lyase family enzyme
MELDMLLNRYDAGRMSRRDLLGALTALLVAPEPPDVGVAKQLNHVTVFVPHVERAHAFYRDLLGMSVLTKQDPGVNLRAGGGFLGLYPAEQGAKARIDHFCFGLENFDADATRAKLVAQGVDATIRLRGDTKELYFTDPDGLRVQLQDVRYRGGVGPLGDRDP